MDPPAASGDATNTGVQSFSGSTTAGKGAAGRGRPTKRARESGNDAVDSAAAKWGEDLGTVLAQLRDLKSASKQIASQNTYIQGQLADCVRFGGDVKKELDDILKNAQAQLTQLNLITHACGAIHASNQERDAAHEQLLAAIKGLEQTVTSLKEAPLLQTMSANSMHQFKLMRFLTVFPCAAVNDAMRDVNQAMYSDEDNNVCCCHRCQNSRRIKDADCVVGECALLRWFTTALDELEISFQILYEKDLIDGCVPYESLNPEHFVPAFDTIDDLVIVQEANRWDVRGYGRIAGLKYLAVRKNAVDLDIYNHQFQTFKRKIRVLFKVFESTVLHGVKFTDASETTFRVEVPAHGEPYVCARLYLCLLSWIFARVRMDGSFSPSTVEFVDDSSTAPLQMSPSPMTPTSTRVPTPVTRRGKKRVERAARASPPPQAAAAQEPRVDMLELWRGLELLRTDHAALRTLVDHNVYSQSTQLADLQCLVERMKMAFSRLPELHELVAGCNVRREGIYVSSNFRPQSARSSNHSNNTHSHTNHAPNPSPHAPAHPHSHHHSAHDSPSPRTTFGGTFNRGGHRPPGGRPDRDGRGRAPGFRP